MFNKDKEEEQVSLRKEARVKVKDHGWNNNIIILRRDYRRAICNDISQCQPVLVGIQCILSKMC